MTTPNSDLQQPSDPNALGSKQETWLAHHNETSILFYDNKGDAESALSGYQMSHAVTIDDISEVLKVV